MGHFESSLAGVTLRGRMGHFGGSLGHGSQKGGLAGGKNFSIVNFAGVFLP